MKMLFLKEAAYANKRVPETFDARGLNSLLARLRKNKFFQIAILVLIVGLKFKELKRRLVPRWRNLEIPEESILGSVDGNNLRNGTTILQNS